MDDLEHVPQYVKRDVLSRIRSEFAWIEAYNVWSNMRFPNASKKAFPKLSILDLQLVRSAGFSTKPVRYGCTALGLPYPKPLQSGLPSVKIVML
jgi:hypothetical protein